MNQTNGDGMIKINGDELIRTNGEQTKRDNSETNHFNRITRLAREALDVQYSALYLMDSNRQWEHYTSGLDATNGFELTGGDHFRSRTMRNDSILVVPDAKTDNRFQGNSWVTDEPHIRFYMGCTLYTRDDHKIGALGVFDSTPREISDHKQRIMQDMKTMVQSELERKNLEKNRLVLLDELNESRRRSRTDELTGLWNRRGILNFINAEIRRSERNKSAISVAMIDLDDFEDVNDTYGHPAGDKVLRRVAKKLQEIIREYDIIGRYGGDEFLAIFPETDQKKTKRIIQRMKNTVLQSDVELEQTTIDISISAGLFTRKTTDSLTPKEMIKHADAALYEAKTKGSNSIK